MTPVIMPPQQQLSSLIHIFTLKVELPQ